MLLCPGDTVIHAQAVEGQRTPQSPWAAALVELISCIYFKPSLWDVSLGQLWAHVLSKISYLCISTFHITSSLTPEIVCWCKMTPALQPRQQIKSEKKLVFLTHPFNIPLWLQKVSSHACQDGQWQGQVSTVQCVWFLSLSHLCNWNSGPRCCLLRNLQCYLSSVEHWVPNPRAIISYRWERSPNSFRCFKCILILPCQGSLFVLEGDCNTVQR